MTIFLLSTYPFLMSLIHKVANRLSSIICLVLCLVYFGDSAAQSPLHSFPLQQITLLPGVFREAQHTDLTYMLAMDPDRLLAPYLSEAGLKPKKERYGNWENTGLDGHIGGHYLSALSLMYASTRDTRMNERLEYMLNQLKRCQDRIGSGYLGGTPGGVAMWQAIAGGQIEAGFFELSKKWVPLYNLHKLLAGLRDAYLVGNKPQAKVILLRLTDYIEIVSRGLSDQQIQTMLKSEHGGLNEVFADVAAFTGHLMKRSSVRYCLLLGLSMSQPISKAFRTTIQPTIPESQANID